MNNWNNNWMNPLMAAPAPIYAAPAPKYDIITVNGEAGAKNFKMAPNSKAALIDETAPIIWLAQTDGTGYLTVTPYDIVPHKTAATIDVNDLAERVKKLEEQYVQQSNVAKPRSKQRQQSTDGATEANGTNV